MSTLGHVTPLGSIGAIDIAIVLPNAVFMILRDTLSIPGCNAILRCYEVQHLSPSSLSSQRVSSNFEGAVEGGGSPASSSSSPRPLLTLPALGLP